MRPGVLLLLALSVTARAVGAQLPQDTVLTRLTAEALASNPSLVRGDAAVRAAQARVPAAGALPDPMLTAGVMDLTLPRFAFHESDFTEVDVELSQEFPWPGTLGARTAAARSEARARGAELAARRRDVIVRTAELYNRLRYLGTAEAILSRQRRLLAAGVDVATARYATTSAPQVDALQARVALARLEADAAGLAAEEASTRAALRALRHIRGPDSIPAGPLDPAHALGTIHHLLPDSTASTADSSALHPRVLARQAALEAAERNVRAEALGGRPDFTVMARYGARPLGSDFFSAFVGVRLPLWAGRKQHQRTAAAAAEADDARAAVTEEQEALAAEIATARAEVVRGQTHLGILVDRVVPAAREAVEASLRSYRVGEVDFATVLASEDALYRAELEAAESAAEHLTHVVMLAQLVAPGEAS